MRTTTAVVYRTEMCGGGTSYDVYFQCADKPSRPLHNQHTYATVISRSADGTNDGPRIEYYDVADAIDRRARWKMRAGLEKWDAYQAHAKRAKRLAYRIAVRAFPELKSLRALPVLWADWSLPSAVVRVPVRVELPE